MMKFNLKSRALLTILFMGSLSCHHNHQNKYVHFPLNEVLDTDVYLYHLNSFGFGYSFTGLKYDYSSGTPVPILPTRLVIIDCVYPEIVYSTTAEKWIELLNKPETRQSAVICVYSIYELTALLLEIEFYHSDEDEFMERESRYLVNYLTEKIEEEKTVNTKM